MTLKGDDDDTRPLHANVADADTDKLQHTLIQTNWHPKLRGYDILVVTLTLAFGLSKAVLSYRGQSTIPTTLDWLYNVVVVLLLYWLDLYERYSSRAMPWLFDMNYLPCFPCSRLVEHTYTGQLVQLHDMLPNSNIPVQPPVTSAWHPKLTGYRLTVVSFTIGFGLATAILNYRGQTTASTTLEWVSVTVVCLILYFLGSIKRERYHNLPWLFEKDYASYLWSSLQLFSCPTPQYCTDERSTVMLIKNQHPPLTGFRLLFTATVVGFGLTQAILTYKGHSTASISLDWVFGVVIVLSLYWLGLYEYNCVGKMTALFDTDYTPQVQVILMRLFQGGFHIGYLFLHVVIFALIAGWTSLWTQGLIQLWSGKLSGTGPHRQAPLSTFDVVCRWIFKCMWSTGACVAVGIGIAGCCAVVWNAVVRIFVPVAKYLKRGFRLDDPKELEARVGLLEWASSVAPTASSTSLISNIFGWFGLVLLPLGYIIAHAIAMLLCAGWSMLWVYGLVVMWKANLAGHDANILLTTFIWSFSLVWSAGAVGAVGVGLGGCFQVLMSLITGFLKFVNWARDRL